MEYCSRSKHWPPFTCRFKPEQFADANFDAAAYVSQLRRMVSLWCPCSCQTRLQTLQHMAGAGAT